MRLAHSRKSPFVRRWKSEEAGLGAVRQQQGIDLEYRSTRFPAHPAHRVKIRDRWKRQQVASPIDGLPGRVIHAEGTERKKHRRQCEGTGNYSPGVSGCLRTSGDDGGFRVISSSYRWKAYPCDRQKAEGEHEPMHHSRPALARSRLHACAHLWCCISFLLRE